MHCGSGKGQWANSETPMQIDTTRDLWWKCRVRQVKDDHYIESDKWVTVEWRPPMDPEDPFNPKSNDSGMDGRVKSTDGLFQIAIAVYRNWSEGKDPICVFTTFVNAIQ